MKRILLMLVLIVSAIGMFSCSSDSPTDNNTVTNSFNVSGTAFTNVMVTCTSVSGSYVMNAGDLGGSASSLSFAFPSTAMPTAGTYNVDGSGAGQVVVAVVVNSESFAATSGSVTITIVGGKVKAVCTNLPLSKVADPTKTKSVTATMQCS